MNTDLETNEQRYTSRYLGPDMVRGLAVCGLVMTNVPLILTSTRYRQVSGESMYSNSISDNIAITAFSWMPAMVGIGMFIVVMGLGLAQGADRATGRLTIVSRFCVLGTLGLIHGLLIWWGDILVYYAIASLLLIPFLHRPPVIQAALGGLLLIAPATVTLADAAAQLGGVSTSAAQRVAQASRAVSAQASPATDAYQSGDILRIAHQRVIDWWAYVQDFAPLGIPQVIGLMLIGTAMARAQMFAPDQRNNRIWRLCAGPLGVVAVVMATAGFVIRATTDDVLSPLVSLGSTADMLSAPLLAIWVTALLIRHSHALIPRNFWRGMASVGRYSITVYLSCSVVTTIIAYGARLYDRFSLFDALTCALVANAVVTCACAAADARGKHGPVERLTRTASSALTTIAISKRTERTTI